MRHPTPILPLKDQVLLPGMFLRTLLLKPASVAMVERHVAEKMPLLVTPQHEPIIEEPIPSDIAKVACQALAHRCVRLGDGTARVLLEGQVRVSLQSVRPDPEWGLVAAHRPVIEAHGDPRRVEVLRTRLAEALREFIQEPGPSHATLARLADVEMPPGRFADHVWSNLTVPWPARIAFLEETSVEARLLMALEGLEREGVLRRLKSEVEKRVQTTLDRQQRDFYIREQIRGLRKELGEGEGAKSGGDNAIDPFDDSAVLEEKIRQAGLPEAGLEEALRELERLRRMHPDAAEYTVTRTWLEWLASMPWKKSSEDAKDLVEALKVLDSDHFGLEKVKERILEYLAVRILKPDGKGPVLCFVGPPGVGKTSLGRSVAKALGRQFQRISLGGVHDEAEIRGHRRTYVGALPGRVANALKRAGTRNPVIVLDEIDKMGKDFRGDPAAALLEVLDPEQNESFIDHYLDVPLDLSQVLFICTANQAEPIPEALMDRLELTELPGYTLEEKLRIAEDHMLPKLRGESGLPEGFLRVGTEAVQHLVEAYTREAGVRSLEQKLSAVHRKVARKLVEGRTEPIEVGNVAAVRDLLGPPRHHIELAERTDLPGIAIGLAWTPSGGDILFIEVTAWPEEKLSLQVTGQLGSVMKESAEAALSVIRTRSVALGIPLSSFKDRTLHLHVPAGAVPKDGPSAGITMCTALAGLLLGRCVKPYLAMTGELTLRGKVLPVGGIKEKVLAARRAGIREIILPRLNENDLVDVPAHARADLEFHLVDTIDQVFELALLPASN